MKNVKIPIFDAYKKYFRFYLESKTFNKNKKFKKLALKHNIDRHFSISEWRSKHRDRDVVKFSLY